MSSSQYNTLLALPVSQLTNTRFRPYLIEFASEFASPCVAEALMQRLSVSQMTSRQLYEYEQIGYVIKCAQCDYHTAYEYLAADDWDANDALASIYLDQLIQTD